MNNKCIGICGISKWRKRVIAIIVIVSFIAFLALIKASVEKNISDNSKSSKHNKVDANSTESMSGLRSEGLEVFKRLR